MNVAVGWQLAGVLVLLTALATLVVAAGRLGPWWQVATAAARAVVQLGAVSLVIVLVLRSGWLTAGFVLVMLSFATLTAAGRITTLRHGAFAGVAIASGVLPVFAILLVTGVLPLAPIAVVPVAGIVIGGAMTATSLAGRRALDELRSRHGEYEAALALGLVERAAALLICRHAASQALVPVLDQTRTVGLVTLPGAFVGVMLGGGTPLQAGATQLVVLVALLTSEGIAVLLTVELVAAGLIARR